MLCFISYLGISDLLVFLLQLDITLFHHLRFQFQLGQNIRLTVFRTTDCCPWTFLAYLFFGATWFERRQHHLFHHLTDNTVAENHSGIAIFEGQGKGEIDKVGHLLYGSRGEDNRIIVAVTTTTGSLEIVALRRLNSSETGTTALYVDDDARYLGTCHIGNALLHQSHAWTG